MKTSLAERASQNPIIGQEANISSECGCLFEKSAAQNICQGVFFLAGKVLFRNLIAWSHNFYVKIVFTSL